MSKQNAYRPYVATKKFSRISKYLFPLDSSAVPLSGSEAPNSLASATELAARFPGQVQIIDLGLERNWGELKLKKVFDGLVETFVFPASPPLHQYVARYENATTMGRHSAVLVPDENGGRSSLSLVQNLGYYLPEGSAAKFTLGKLNPKFWISQWLIDLRSRRRLPPISKISGSVAILNNPWCHNFYHWLLEVAPRAMMLERTEQRPDWYSVDCQSGYQRRALEMMGIAKNRLIQPHYGLHLKPDVLLQPSYPGYTEWKSMARNIKQALPEVFRPKANVAQRRLYITRRHAAHRKLANEPEVENLLRAHGLKRSPSKESTSPPKQA